MRISRESVKIYEEVGKGSFGVVYKGTCNGVDAAFKSINVETYLDAQAFENEVQMIRYEFL